MPACSEDQKYMFSKSLKLNPESPACSDVKQLSPAGVR